MLMLALLTLGTSPNAAAAAKPKAPTGLTATVVSSNQINLAWTASMGATSYRVKRSLVGGGPYTTIVTNTTVSWNNTGLSSSTTYYYVVSAVNGSGESPNSSQASATTQAGGPPAMVTSLKVMSMNIQVNGSGAGGITQVINAIRTAGADIVGLQEADGYTTKPIADGLGFYWIQTGGAGQFSLISRYPIVNRIGETVTNAYGGVGATIELSPDQRVHLFSAHLNWTPYGPYWLKAGSNVTTTINMENSTRMPGLNELLGMASSYIGNEEPAFLVGDFNAPSDEDYSPAVAWPTTIACRNAGLTDSYHQLHVNTQKSAGQFLFNDPGITWTPNGATSEPNGCYDRIDFIWYVNGHATPTNSAELDTRNDVSPWPSDHRAVISTFTLPVLVQQAKAAAPLPANTGMVSYSHPALTWIIGTDTLTDDVYFGTTSPGTLQTNQNDSKFYPAGHLSPNTTYYWRVDEHKISSTVTGDVWSFTTRNFSWAQPSSLTYAENAAITVNFGNAKTARDWIGIYNASSAYGPGGTPSISWKYLNNSQTAPGSPVTSGNITLNGLPAGAYKIRFFANDGFLLMDETGITVQ